MIDLSSLSDLDDEDLLLALIMGEAEGESIVGKLAVGCVVRNRLDDPRWPNTWAGVMLQKYQFSCFLESYFRPGILRHDWQNIAWREAKLAAHGIMHGYCRDITHGANHYHARWMKRLPKWAKSVSPVAEIGNHRFYAL
jgi:N-acetylmuramoyl-L-alanine amidase